MNKVQKAARRRRILAWKIKQNAQTTATPITASAQALITANQQILSGVTIKPTGAKGDIIVKDVKAAIKSAQAMTVA